MTRIAARLLGLAALLVALVAGLGGSAVSAQQPYPGTGAPTVLSGQFNPGGSGTLRVGNLPPNTSQPAVINSTPISISGTSDAAGNLTYSFAVPADFALNASHTVNFTVRGITVTFCVNQSGAVAACNTIGGGTTTTTVGGGATTTTVGGRGNNIPRTGADYVDDGLRFAGVAIGGGGLLVLWRRRRLVAA